MYPKSTPTPVADTSRWSPTTPITPGSTIYSIRGSKLSSKTAPKGLQSIRLETFCCQINTKSNSNPNGEIPTCTRPNFAGVPDALIFFCFFSSIKRRKEDHEALLDFLMRHSFLSLRKEKKQKKLKPSTEGGEVFPGTSRISGGSDSLKLLTYKYVPSQIWLSNGTFFSFLEKRKEAKETQALFRGRGSFSGYLENSRKS